MPTYILKSSKLKINKKKRDLLAKGITRIHSKVTGANSYFAQVIFQENINGSHYMGGKPVQSKEVFLHGHIRAGRTNVIKKKLIDTKLVIDSLDIARNKFPGSSNSLDALCKRFNIDLSRRVKHNALLDCELLREVYINLLDAKEPKFNLISSSEQKINNIKEYNKLVVKISDTEIKKHKDFLKSEIKKNNY